MTRGFAVGHWEIPETDTFARNVEDQGVVKAIGNPRPKTMLLEKHSFLPELVQLGVAVQESGRYVLVTDTHRKRWENSKQDVIE